jgi:hypothetical protein
MFVKRHERDSLNFSGSSGWGTRHVAINCARIRAVAYCTQQTGI